MAISQFKDTAKGYQLTITFGPKITYTLTLGLLLIAQGKGLTEADKEISKSIEKLIMFLLEASPLNRKDILKYIEDSISEINSLQDILNLLEQL